VSPGILLDFLVDCDCYVFLRDEVAELDDSLSVAGQLSPAAGLLGILLDGLVFLAVEEEAGGAQALAAGASDTEFASVDFDLGAGHELFGDGE